MIPKLVERQLPRILTNYDSYEDFSLLKIGQFRPVRSRLVKEAFFDL